MDSTLIAYVAEAYESVTGDRDYDAAADKAAALLRDSKAVREAATAYASGEVSMQALQTAVYAAVR